MHTAEVRSEAGLHWLLVQGRFSEDTSPVLLEKLLPGL